MSTAAGGPPAAVAALLARLFVRELDAGLLQALRHPDVVAVLDRVEPGCAGYVTAEWDDRRYREAAADFCGLFLLPGGAPPRAVAWLPGEPSVTGAQLLARIDRHLASAGLTTAEKDPGLAADHVGVLLAGTAVLLERDDAAAAGLVEEFLRPWVARFAAAVRARTPNPLYRAAAGLLPALLEQLQQVDAPDAPAVGRRAGA